MTIAEKMEEIRTNIELYPRSRAELRLILDEYCMLNEKRKAFAATEAQYESIKEQSLNTLAVHVTNLKDIYGGIRGALTEDLLEKLISMRRSTEIINRVSSNLTTATDVFKDGNG